MESDDETDTFSVLINTCYGGFGLSKEAVELYLNRKKVSDPMFKYHRSDLDREDPILIQIYYELGDKINGQSSEIDIVKINNKYKDCYHIHEYDGSERIKIDYNKYRLIKIRNDICEILNNNLLSSDEKISKIKELEFISKGY